MKKQYLHLICAVCMAGIAYGGIKKCQDREAAAPSAEIIEAAEEASRQVPEQGPAPEMKRIEPADSAETADSVLMVQMERYQFEALVKIADGGKVYALDTDGKRSPKAFKTFDEYVKFITDNPQYPKNHYSYDKDGSDFNVDFQKTTIQKN